MGLAGAMLGQAIGMLIYVPIIARLAWRHRVWDARHDLVYLAIACSFGLFAIWFNWEHVYLLFPGTGGGFHGGQLP
jgi:integral membrane sensor domain MASE1